MSGAEEALIVELKAEIKRLHIARLTDAGTHAREHRTAEAHIQSLRDDCAELRRCLDAATGAEP